MTLAEIKQQIALGESDTIEFKRSTAKLKEAAQTLCAFLNGEGGNVFIGVSNDQTLIGQEVSDKTKIDISNALKKFEPTANIDVAYIDLNKDKQIIVLTAHPDSRCIPYSFDGKAFEREQADTHVMKRARYQQLLLKKNIAPTSWERQYADGFGISDLDHEEIAKMIKLGVRKGTLDASIENESIDYILTKLGLLESGQLNNAAIVLFAKTPETKYIQCTLRMARFKGTEKKTFIDSKHSFGHAFHLLSEAESFIRRNTAVASHFIEGQMERVDEPEYPFKAVREALINALCHRDYASPGGAITLTIYDDRLEIINTGLLPEGITLPELEQLHTSHPRNPYITSVFYRCGFIESMGMGTQEIIRICADANMKPPEFFEQAGTFIVRLWSRQSRVDDVNLSCVEQINLSKRQEAILTLLKEGECTPAQILSGIKKDISERTLRRDLQTLKEKGLIDSEGQSGPKTLWFIKETRT